MGKAICPERSMAYRFLCRLERAGLEDTMVYRMVANEFDRDLYTAVSRLHLALPKAEPLVAALVDAGRSRPRRRIAIAAIRAAKMRVR
jgi:hypothetical protein